MSANLHIAITAPQAEGAEQERQAELPPPPRRSARVWVAFLFCLVALSATGFVAVREHPAMAEIRYLAHYPHDVSLSGPAIGYFKWRYESIVAYAPLETPLTVLIGDRKLTAAELTPKNLAEFGAVSSSEPESTLWRLTRGPESLFCDYRGGQLVQVWIQYNADTTQSPDHTTQNRIGIAWADRPTAYLPLAATDLEKHFGPPNDVVKERKFRFLALQ